MKTNLLRHTLHSAQGLPLLPLLRLGAILLVIGVTPRTAAGAAAAELLEKGIYTEETKGALSAATEIYRQIVEDPAADRSLVAQAQLRLGLCELKLGHKPQAISALDKLTRDFPDKNKLLGLVEPHMPQLLDDIIKQIEQNYIKEVDRNELMETALRAIVGKLDSSGGLGRTEETSFLGTNEMAELTLNLEQKLGGIGAALKRDETTHEIVVMSVLPNSPARQAGLLEGDHIVRIDGRPLPDSNQVQTAVKWLRGEPGSAVSVKVKREGSEQLKDFDLVRAVVRLASVHGDHRKADGASEFFIDSDNRIGYIRLSQVGKSTPQEMKAALEELSARGLRGLVLDLRNNPGGALAEAVTVADLFVESGRILTVKSRSQEQIFEAKAEGTFTNFPIAVLVNRGTASAAEIIAACLQDHHRATIVGERTFGQGIVRSLIPLQGNAGTLKLPVAVYYRPNGKEMNRYPGSTDTDDWGISPDPGYEVTMGEEEEQQLLRRRNEYEKNPTPAPGTRPLADRALQRALDCLFAAQAKK